MTREKYLYELREALGRELSESEIEGHIRYYGEYLSDIGDGKTLEEKLEVLGEPRLIAKTIIDTASTQGSKADRANDENPSYTYGSKSEQTENTGNAFKVYRWDNLAWYQKLLAILMGALIVIAIVAILVLGVNIFLSIVLPVLIVVFIIKLIVHLIRK